MPTATYRQTKGRLETYFDRTAAEAWARLTSDAPVSRIRATVRAGRDRMRQTLLDWLPADLSGARLLDAGCGAGQLSIEAARRGAEVVAIDVAPALIRVARERAPTDLVGEDGAGEGHGSIRFLVGDMLDASLGRFDHVVAMDSLIHYHASDICSALEGLAARTNGSIVFTFAPRTPALTAMHTAGKLFPRSDRSPAIAPVSPARLTRLIRARDGLRGVAIGRTERIVSGFYTSQAMELLINGSSGQKEQPTS